MSLVAILLSAEGSEHYLNLIPEFLVIISANQAKKLQ